MNKDFNPLVSICIPIFNGGSFVSRALESSINQTYKNIEIIVVDNASTDNTRKIIDSYIAKDKRIKYFRNDFNIGAIKNFLKSFQFASGEYVQLLCHDDWLSKNYIEEGIKNFNLYPDTAAVFSRILAFVIQPNNEFIFTTDVRFKNKNYPIGYFFKTFYRNQLGANDILAMFRRKDIVGIQPFILGMLENPNFNNLYQIGLIVDRLFASKVLVKYSYFTYTDKSAYMKIEHSSNIGKQLDSYNSIEKLKYMETFRKCFEYFYTKELKKYLLSFRVNFGLDIINEPIITFVKGNFSSLSPERLNKKQLSLFFRDYSLPEKTFIAISIIPSLIVRIFKSIKRRLTEKQFFLYPCANCFLNKEKHFEID